MNSDPYLIIVTSQNSLSRTDNHFQHYFGEVLLKDNNWRRLLKIDATKPIHTSSMSSIFSKILKDPDPYNVRTRIYYRIDKVCLEFKDEELSKKSCFTNQRSNYNDYIPKIEFRNKCKNQDYTIMTYYMKRYSDKNEKLSKTGNGIITIGLLFRIITSEKSVTYKKLIISNRCNVNDNFNGNVLETFKYFNEGITDRMDVHINFHHNRNTSNHAKDTYIVRLLEKLI